MKSFFNFLLLTFILSSCLNCKKNDAHKIESEKEWTSIFNGKNLEDWIVKINGHKLGDNYLNTFRVEDGMLKVSYDKYDNFTDEYGHLFYKTPYTNYRLRLEYRFVGEQVNGGEAWAEKNSGIMIHSQAPETMLLNQGFPLSLEVQLLGGVEEGVSRPSGNLCTPATHVEMNGKKITKHCIMSKSKTFYGEEWIQAEVFVTKDSIAHFIDGELVISYSKPSIGGEYLDSASEIIQAKDTESLTKGYISLQSESHPVEFKKIQILEL